MAQTTLTRARMCILGVSLILLLILEVKYPQNPNFGGMNRRFQAKRAKYWKFPVIETTASILTKFGRTIETMKMPSPVVPIGTQQIQDSGRRPFWKKTLNRLISATFGRFWWNLARWRTLAPGSRFTVKILYFWKSILKNHKNRDISAMVWRIYTKFGTLMQNGPLNRPDRYKIWISQKQDGGRPPFWKPQNRHISATVWPILMKFGTVTHIGP